MKKNDEVGVMKAFARKNEVFLTWQLPNDYKKKPDFVLKQISKLLKKRPIVVREQDRGGMVRLHILFSNGRLRK